MAGNTASPGRVIKSGMLSIKCTHRQRQKGDAVVGFDRAVTSKSIFQVFGFFV